MLVLPSLLSLHICMLLAFDCVFPFVHYAVVCVVVCVCVCVTAVVRVSVVRSVVGFTTVSAVVDVVCWFVVIYAYVIMSNGRCECGCGNMRVYLVGIRAYDIEHS